MDNAVLLKTLENKLEQLSKLENTNKNLNKQLVELNEKLKESERLKTHFISNVMNELINPFSSILGLSGSIIQLGGNQMDKAKNLATMIYNEAFNIDFQLSNIFMAARIEAGEISPNASKTEINGIIGQLIRNYYPDIKKKKLKLIFTNQSTDDTSLPFYFPTDHEKFRFIINNLLNNAIKYSPENGRVGITLLVADSILNINIMDEGKGIPEGMIDEVFDRFKQIDNSVNTLNPGHGLGLSIVKALVETLNGTITAETQSGKGSVFNIQLPALETNQIATATDINELLF